MNRLVVVLAFAGVGFVACFSPVLQRDCDAQTPCGSGWQCVGGVCVPPGGSGGGGSTAGGGSPCAGCLDAKGACTTGLSNTACGKGVGVRCVTCGANQRCDQGTCTTSAGGGGGSLDGGGGPGGGGGSTGGGGGSTGGGSAGCNAGTCPNGCCSSAGVCQPGTATTACGTSGKACVGCGSGVCVSKTCVGGGSCGPSTCAGCCVGNTCVPTSVQSPLNCGTNGVVCTSCSNGQTCSDGTCGAPCSPSNCSGCCDALGACRMPSSTACGAKGGACVACPSGLSCDSVTGQCRGPGCQMSCPSCCIGDACQLPPPSGACFKPGGTCTTCLSGQTCQSGACVSTPMGQAGSACTTNAECALLGAGAECRKTTPNGTPYPNGFCTKVCMSSNDCGATGLCVAPQGLLGEQNPLCVGQCSMFSCRQGYQCYSGGPNGVCWLPVGADGGS